MLCWPLLVTKSMDSQTYHFNLLRHWFLNNYYISVYLGPKIWGHLILLANYQKRTSHTRWHHLEDRYRKLCKHRNFWKASSERPMKRERSWLQSFGLIFLKMNSCSDEVKVVVDLRPAIGGPSSWGNLDVRPWLLPNHLHLRTWVWSLVPSAKYVKNLVPDLNSLGHKVANGVPLPNIRSLILAANEETSKLAPNRLRIGDLMHLPSASVYWRYWSWV